MPDRKAQRELVLAQLYLPSDIAEILWKFHVFCLRQKQLELPVICFCKWTVHYCDLGVFFSLFAFFLWYFLWIIMQWFQWPGPLGIKLGSMWPMN